MTDTNQASTIEEDEAFKALVNTKLHELPPTIVDWQKEYQFLFIKVDKNLTRAIEAEGNLAVAKELLAEQEIQLARQNKRMQVYREAVRLARESYMQAERHLNAVANDWMNH
jgi:hypothetical protein